MRNQHRSSTVTFTADVKALQKAGVDIKRANLATDPTKFGEDQTVITFMNTAGSEGLPLILVDGVTVVAGRYPSRDELCHWAQCYEPGAEAHESCCSANKLKEAPR
ncbi:arsenic metallochaperone ArsD family protein [Arcanobacterium ihumii]|uniref:arsenic metallochaperone ArsD family protein n=1 Tax=Arcanobacterium ihumii TaxID=2138162 RepID=UPI00190F0FFE|nr:arsenic metallochaperone ArsD family protein [Arcanobacterium ihumii]